MTEVDFDQYSEQSVHFFSRRVPKLLAAAIKEVGSKATVVDVGCGDGHLVWALHESGYLPNGCRVLGADLSPIRLRRFRELTGFQGIMVDGHHIPTLESGSVDLVLSTMVIEHVPDDLGHVRELARITRSGGMLYLSTVIRKHGSWYFRKAPDGRRVLDPTHLREYPSVADVTKLVEAGGFVIKEQRLSRLLFPVIHPFIRWLHARSPINDVQRLFLKPSTRWLEFLAIPIPRYRAIEIVARRVDGSSQTVKGQAARDE